MKKLMFQIGMMLTLVGCGKGFEVAEYSSLSLGQGEFENVETPVGPACEVPTDVGRVTLHRLNRAEYNNTVRDLFGVTSNPASAFAEDGAAETFNNNADVHSVNSTLMVKYMEAAATVSAQAITNRRSSIITCTTTDDNCLRNIITALVLKVYRRPALGDEVTRLLGLAKFALAQGGNLDKSIQHTIQAMLVSPQFLFRRIQHSNPDDPNVVVNISQYELASRLSYFLWSSTPDTELLNLAGQSRLKDPVVLKQQVQRMMKDAKASSLLDNFSNQWLQLSKLNQHSVDAAKFPTYNANLRQDMITETRMFMNNMISKDLSFMEMLNANYTFVNQRLASHYGVQGNGSDNVFAQVSIAATSRQGILGHGSIMTMTSHASETSIIHRGKWILKNMLCDLPPPPPSGIPAPDPNLSEFERSQQRLNAPSCSICHATMDPVGTGLQSLNAIGQERLVDEAGRAVDNLGKLPDGRTFRGPKELANLVSQDGRFKACVTKKMLTYALGRELQAYDKCTVNKIAAASVGADKSVSQLVQMIVESPLFQQQRGDGGRQ